jgi:hypothetical protein
VSTPTIGVHSRARAVIVSVARGHGDIELARLTELGRRDPRRLAELVIELALLATLDGVLPWLVGEQLPVDEELLAAVLRHAHALHNRRVRPAWVMWGERRYQLEARRRRRAAGRA